jgi:5'-phosphate synthase pdxT subunit
MKIGVLALQGAFLEHEKILQNLGIETEQIRFKSQLENIDGLIIPGGESTVIGKLSLEMGLFSPLKEFGKKKAVWGTCAGAIFLSNDPVLKENQPLLGLLNIEIERNAFGRQVDSFEFELKLKTDVLSSNMDPFRAVFIRAPLIKKVGSQVQVIATLAENKIVAVRENNLLATSFHPELTDDYRFHKYFIEMVEEYSK